MPSVGFGLCYCRCGKEQRLNTILLLAALASLVVWLLGLAARSMQLHRHLQANTERRREVLSPFFIGRELLRQGCSYLGPRHLAEALLTLRNHISLVFPPEIRGDR